MVGEVGELRRQGVLADGAGHGDVVDARIERLGDAEVVARAAPVRGGDEGAVAGEQLAAGIGLAGGVHLHGGAAGEVDAVVVDVVGAVDGADLRRADGQQRRGDATGVIVLARVAVIGFDVLRETVAVVHGAVVADEVGVHLVALEIEDNGPFDVLPIDHDGVSAQAAAVPRRTEPITE